MANGTAAADRATYRTVILLRHREKVRLERMASEEQVSSAEVIRRFIRLGNSVFKKKQEEEVIESALKIISSAVSEANDSLSKTIDKLDRLHIELSKREIK
jgi:RNA polymerase-interacting CarD/CdnL/TRCF family regulator